MAETESHAQVDTVNTQATQQSVPTNELPQEETVNELSTDTEENCEPPSKKARFELDVVPPNSWQIQQDLADYANKYMDIFQPNVAL